MPKPPKLAFVEKNSGMLIEELLLAGVDPDRASLREILDLCTHYRRVGVCRWLTRGDADALFTELTNGAWVFAAWLQRHQTGDRCTARIEPFIDALVAEADHAAQAIIAHSRETWNEEAEYEDDFCYARILHHLVKNQAGQAPSLLDRWTIVSGGGEPRHQVCTALLSHDTGGLIAGMERLLENTEAEAQKNPGRGDPDAAVTTDRLFLEGIALLKIARKLGLKPAMHHRLIHAGLLSSPTKPLPGPDEWKTIESHRELT